ncbi:MAG: FAD-binding oxidoreductase [Chloroflexi bacterium]|nr:FAD-binding oxidoreductase [Chloroflexota bacterium]
MATTTDVLIIGAGIAGSSVAYHLAKKGVKGITLTDRSTVAAGATGKSGAEMFLHHADVKLLKVAWESYQILKDWPQAEGGDIGYRQTGVLFIFGPEHRKDAEANADVVRKNGVSVSVLSPEEVKDLQPFLRVDDIGGAIYTPEAGHGDGHSAASAMLTKAREKGVLFMRDTVVAGLEAKGGRVTGVRLASGEWIEAGTVVLAAGAWSAQLAKTIGLELPITPYRVCAGIFSRPPEVPSHMAMTDRTIGTYWRMEGPDLTLMGIRNKEVMAPCDLENVPQGVREVDLRMWARRITHRIPAMEKGGLRTLWSAPDAYTPDHYPLVGPAPGFDGLYLATGYSGSGFMRGPATGKCLAELIADGAVKTADISAMSPDRFAKGKANVPAPGYHWPYDPEVDRRFPAG